MRKEIKFEGGKKEKSFKALIQVIFFAFKGGKHE